ncbi:hypothetical protein ACQEU3_47025 [Spirillospora sp. CA-253888]
MTSDYYRNPTFEQHASPDAITAHLTRERAARDRINRRITWLEQLLDRRTHERNDGHWPATGEPAS